MKNYYRLFLVAIAAFCLAVGVNAQKTATIKKLAPSTSVTIDGVEDEAFWSSAEEFTGITYNNASPTDQYDHKLHYWKAVWNDTAIFFLFKVDDDNVYPNDHWAADQVEMYFRFGGKDILDKDIYSYQDTGVYQVPCRLTEAGVAHEGSYEADTNNYYTQTTEVKTGTHWGYTTEAYVKWDYFVEYSDTAEGDTIPVEPKDGYSFNFDANFQDNDADPADEELYPDYDNLARGYWSSNGHLWKGNWDTMTPGTMILDSNLVNSVQVQTLKQFEIHPNPVQDVLTIQGDDVDVDEAVIYSITGKAVLRSSLVNKNTINVSGLYNGVYLLELYNEGEYLGTKKIIVAKE